MEPISLNDVANIVNGTLEGQACDNAHQSITGINTLRAANASEVSFLANRGYVDDLKRTNAAAVFLAANDTAPDHCHVIRVADPYVAFATLQCFFHPQPKPCGKRHSSADIDRTAVIAEDVDIAAHVVIGTHTRIGAGTIIQPGCIIGDHVRIGERCLLHANTVIHTACEIGNDVILQAGVIIGSDGFGYAWNGSKHVKIPQVGRVIIEDDVEIGANTCIDRGAIDDTVIERGVKLDNLVQIAHNVRIGAYSVMASQGGVSGSSSVGKGCQIGGQTGIAGHITIGDGVKLAGKTGVMSNLAAGGTYAGAPAMPHRLWLKVSAIMLKLPEFWKTQRNQ